MSDLPEGWVETTLGSVAHFVMGQAPPGSASNFNRVGTPFVKAGEFGVDRPTIREWTTQPLKMATESDVLVCVVGATSGKVNLGVDCAIGRSVAAIRPVLGLDQYFLYAFLKTKVQELRRNSTGTAQGVISNQMLSAVGMPLPPFAEQRRIVRKLDELMTRSARARSDLEGIPTLIRNYKKALLAAAFSGELTREWREAMASKEERAEWRHVQLDDIIDEGPTNGWSPPSGPDATGAYSLKLTATTSGFLRLDSEAVKRIHATPPINSKYWLHPDDLLIQRANTIEYVGASAIFDGPSKKYIYPDLMMRVRINEPMLRQFVWRFLNSEKARSYFRRNATGTAGNMPKINGKTVRSLPLLLPPPDEQREIVLRIETAFAWLDKVAVEHARVEHLLLKLDQAVLAKAFRGNLVPQSPTDEPASILLERIRAARGNRNRKLRDHPAPRAPRENATMTKNRHDEDVKDKPYLANLLRQTAGSASIEDLFKRAELPVTDFYKQLAWEVDAGHIKDNDKKLEAF